MISDKTDPKLNYDGFQKEYYFSIEKKDGQKKLLVHKIDFRTSLSNWAFSKNKEKYLNDLVKAYFHCMKNRSLKREPLLTLPASPSSSSDPGTSSNIFSVPQVTAFDVECESYNDLITELFHTHFQTTQIAFATWNIGGPEDFLSSLPLYNKDTLPTEWKEEDLSPQSLTENKPLWYSRRIELIKAKIDELNADIVCLQEIGQDDIAQLNDWFISKRYTIVADCCGVLFKNDRFDLIDKKIIAKAGRLTSQVKLGLKGSDQTITVGSGHMTGFKLRKIEKLGKLEKPFGIPSGREYRPGDNELTHFSDELAADRGISSAILLGVDANSNEFVHPERIAIPLQLGFKRNTHNDGKTTAFNRSLGEAQLDHLYWLKGRCVKIQFEPDPLPILITLPSDHKIVSGKVTIVQLSLTTNS